MVGDGNPTLPGLKGLEELTLGPLGSVHCQPQPGASLLRPHVGCRSLPAGAPARLIPVTYAHRRGL